MHEPMNLAETIPNRATPEPLPENIRSVQPGGGVCYRIELAWGRWRRWWLKHFRPGYVAPHGRPAAGRPPGRPARNPRSPRPEVLPQPLRVLLGAEADDPFRWRGRLPFARWGLAELQLMGWPLLALTVCWPRVSPGTWRCCRRRCWRWSSISSAIRRGECPQEPGLVVSPADGKVAEITQLGARRVHRRAGRADRHLPVDLQRPLEPCARWRRRVIALRYSPGRIPQRLAAGKRAAERKHVDRPGGRVAAAPAAGRAADFRGHRPADRLRPAARRSARPRAEVRHDQARLADRIDPARTCRDLPIDVDA